MQSAFPTSNYYELIRLPNDLRFSCLPTQYTTHPPAGIIWASQVLDAPLYTCHGLRTPPTLHNLAVYGCFTWTSSTLQLSSIGRSFVFGAIPALQDRDNPYGLCNSLCTLHLVCLLAVKKFFFLTEKSETIH